MNKRISVLCFLAMAVLGLSTALSQNVTGALGKTYLNSMTTFVHTLAEPQLSTITGGTATFKDKMSMGLVEFGFDQDLHTCYDEYRRFELEVFVEYTRMNTWPSGTQVINENRVLIIEYDPTTNRFDTEKALWYFPNAYDIEVTLGACDAFDISGQPVVYPGTNYSGYPADLYLDVKLDFHRFYNFNHTQVPSLNVSYSGGTIHQVLVNTTSSAPFAEFLDIEWVYVDDYDPSSDLYATELPANQLEVIFKNNASRVRVAPEDLPYAIPAVYDRGYIVCRSRFVGRDPGDLDKTIYGPWDISQTFVSSHLVSNIQTSFPGNYVHIDDTRQHEANKNWAFGAAYTERGHSSPGISYADGTLRSRQQVGYVFSSSMSSGNSYSVVSETIYDHAGRPAIQTLPVTSREVRFQYYENFNVNGSSQKYSYKDFDLDPIQVCDDPMIPAPFGTSSGAGRYYSSMNAQPTEMQAYTPDADGYPFAAIRYTPDPTGRISAQGGLGNTHVLGGAHDVEYYYAVPLQTELDMLFGTDVGYENYYKKMITVDENGQVSVSYYNISGNVVATALAGEAPVSLDAIKDEDTDVDLYTQEKITLEVDLLNKSQNYEQGSSNILSPDGKSLIINRQIGVSSPGDYEFSYNVMGVDFEDECLPSLCFDCVYDVTISLTDDCGLEMIPSGPLSYRIGGTAWDDACNEDEELGEQTFVVADLPVGSYTLTKKLSVVQESIDYYVDRYLAENTCQMRPSDFYVAPDTMDCEKTCESCREELTNMGSFQEFFDHYMASVPDPEPGESLDLAYYEDYLRAYYDQKVAICEKLCQLPSSDACGTALSMMLSDLSLNGQYAQYNTDQNGNVTVPYILSVFNENNFLPRRQNQQLPGSYFHNGGSSPTDGPLPNWRNPKYKVGNSWVDAYMDANGNHAMITLQVDAFGNFDPPVLDPLQVGMLNGAYVSPPSNLLNVKDFISRWDDSWARSLLVYHPEYFHYEYCAEVVYDEEDVAGEDMNSNQYDAWLAALPFAQAQTLFAPNWELQSLDPYFIHHGTDLVIVSPAWSVNDIQGLLENHFHELEPAGFLNIWQSVYANNYLSGNPAFTDANDFITAMPSSNADDLIITANDWATLVMFYASIKQKTMSAAQHIHAVDKQNNNGCIGNPDFLNGINVALSGTPFYNPCDGWSGIFYHDRDIRFPNASYAMDHLPFENNPPTAEELQQYADQQYFQETGNCPLARDLKNMLTYLAYRGNLYGTTVNLENSVYITPALASALAGISDDYQYTPQLLQGGKMFIEPLAGNTCALSLYFSQSTPAHVIFQNVVSFLEVRNVSWNGSFSHFEMTAVIKNPATGFDETHTVYGDICLDLTGCGGDFKKFCKVTGQTEALFRLMNVLNSRDELTSSVNLSSSDLYSVMLTPELVAPIVPGGNYQWSYNSGSDEFRLTNLSTFPLQSIVVTIQNWNSINPANPFAFLNVRAPQPLSNVSGTGSTIEMDALQPVSGVTPQDFFLGTVVPSAVVEAEITLENSGGIFIASRCSDLQPLQCQTPANDNMLALLSVVESLLVLDVDAGLLSGSQCIQNLKVAMENTVPDFGDYTSLLSLVADMDYAQAPGVSYHFKAVLMHSDGYQRIITGEYCQPLSNCEDCDASCRHTMTVDMASDPERPSLYTLTNLSGNSCLAFMNQVAEFDPLTTSLDLFMEEWAQVLNASYPHLTVKKNEAQLVFSFPDYFFQGACGCANLPEVDVAYTNALEGTVSMPDAVFQCCGGSTPTPANCREEIEAYQAQYQAAIAAENNQYISQVQAWNVLCATDPYGTGCASDLANIESSHTTTLAGIHLYWEGIISSAEANCDMWSNHGLVVETTCDPAFQLPELEPYEAVDCAENLESIAQYNAQHLYEDYLENQRLIVEKMIVAHCMQALESFSMQYDHGEYQYTLYYYDRAGNLIRTVPPKAVNRITGSSDLADVKLARDQGLHFLPSHANQTVNGNDFKLTTRYWYNSLNQAVAIRNQEEGETRLWYDAMGRIILTQDEKQRTASIYSYTKYDPLGRITETGRLSSTTAINQSIAGNPGSYNSWLSNASNYREVTRAFYDEKLGTLTYSQQHLRNRVSTIVYYDDLTQISYNSAIHYSYDFHGNITRSWHEDLSLPVTGSNPRLSTVYYYYDLASGNLTGQAYNPDRPDRYFHRYGYDRDNRMTETWSWEGYEWGSAGLNISSLLNWEAQTLPLEMITIWPWDRESRHLFYQHGPVSRVELGQNNVQGVDYIYRIDGSLKSINAATAYSPHDPGFDADGLTMGNPHVYFAEDAYGITLDYFQGDYQPVATFSNQALLPGVNGLDNTDYRELFNGNISRIFVTLKEPVNHTRRPLVTWYHYDQLQRLTKTFTSSQMDYQDNHWEEDPLTPAFIGNYACEYEYDENGNITRLLRNGAAAINKYMDDLTYHYTPGTNQLNYVSDATALQAYTDDIKNQSANNYAYDPTGNLEKDLGSEISHIEWNLYGKVKTVTRVGTSALPNLEFTYDPAGRRISKKATYPGSVVKYTLYKYDAGGNVMGIYETESLTEIILTESPVYGAGRLGMKNREEDMSATVYIDPAIQNVVQIVRGHKYYELSNHLGNVLSVVSDRKKRVCDDGDFVMYEPDIITATDYYAFGMPMPGRRWEKVIDELVEEEVVVYESEFNSNGFTQNGSIVTYEGWTHWSPSDIFPVGDGQGGYRVRVTSGHCAHGTHQYFNVTPGETYTFTLDIDLGTTSRVNVIAWQQSSPTGPQTQIGTSPVIVANANGTYTVSITPTESILLIQVRQDDCDVTRIFYMDNVSLTTITTTVVQHNVGSYRYGFNGMEKDNEVTGYAGMSYTAEYWQYDPRLGRRWNIDPLAYEWQSPYAAFNNNPAYFADPLGLEGQKGGQSQQRTESGGVDEDCDCPPPCSVLLTYGDYDLTTTTKGQPIDGQSERRIILQAPTSQGNGSSSGAKPTSTVNYELPPVNNDMQVQMLDLSLKAPQAPQTVETAVENLGSGVGDFYTNLPDQIGATISDLYEKHWGSLFKGNYRTFLYNKTPVAAVEQWVLPQFQTTETLITTAVSGNSDQFFYVYGNGIIAPGIIGIIVGNNARFKAPGNVRALGVGNNFKFISDKMLKRAGLDAHAIKTEYLGPKNISKYDLYKNTNTGEILIFRKGGIGEPIHTGYYIK